MARLRTGEWANVQRKAARHTAGTLSYLDKQMEWFALARERAALESKPDDVIHPTRVIFDSVPAWQTVGLPEGRSMRIFLTGKHREESIAHLSNRWREVYIMSRFGEEAIRQNAQLAKLLAWHGYVITSNAR